MSEDRINARWRDRVNARSRDRVNARPRDDETAYLEYELSDGRRVMLAFANINDRDGCHISLDMYKVQLGPIDDEVLHRILGKFHGWVLGA
ncbi:MAG: hypothetical protein K6T63_12840 [Alicyclobacillus herbarius]|uniref:hypothetical protein n=1 Tax=Alicyclobacillus herbarius TaxID=122960 RepID=UPI0003FCDC38|nr:hypothetical protein [Alicyclobacillus herbarius]MCL6633504.1 hypothetical protein [Alicyclobacillus herbarius]